MYKIAILNALLLTTGAVFCMQNNALHPRYNKSLDKLIIQKHKNAMKEVDKLAESNPKIVRKKQLPNQHIEQLVVSSSRIEPQITYVTGVQQHVVKVNKNGKKNNKTKKHLAISSCTIVPQVNVLENQPSENPSNASMLPDLEAANWLLGLSQSNQDSEKKSDPKMNIKSLLN